MLELPELLPSNDPSIALAAREALLRMTSDDSRRVSAAEDAIKRADGADAAVLEARDLVGSDEHERVQQEAYADEAEDDGDPPHHRFLRL